MLRTDHEGQQQSRKTSPEPDAVRDDMRAYIRSSGGGVILILDTFKGRGHGFVERLDVGYERKERVIRQP